MNCEIYFIDKQHKIDVIHLIICYSSKTFNPHIINLKSCGYNYPEYLLTYLNELFRM